MFKILRLFNRIISVIFCNGEKRLKLAVENIAFVALAVVCAWGAYELIGKVQSIFAVGEFNAETIGIIVAIIIGIIVCFSTGIYALIAGIVSQAVLLAFAIVGIVLSRSRDKNFFAFLIALISLGVSIVICLYLLNVI